MESLYESCGNSGSKMISPWLQHGSLGDQLMTDDCLGQRATKVTKGIQNWVASGGSMNFRRCFMLKIFMNQPMKVLIITNHPWCNQNDNQHWTSKSWWLTETHLWWFGDVLGMAMAAMVLDLSHDCSRGGMWWCNYHGWWNQLLQHDWSKVVADEWQSQRVSICSRRWHGLVHATGELIPAMDGHGTFRCLGPKMMMNWGPYNFGQSHMWRDHTRSTWNWKERGPNHVPASVARDGITSPLVEVSTASHN